MPDSTRVAIATHRSELNPAREFLEGHFVESPGERVQCASVYSEYRDFFCRERRVDPLTDKQFGREVRRVFPSVERKQARSGSTRAYYYVVMKSRSERLP